LGWLLVLNGLYYYYIGPVDGHNVENPVIILKNVKSTPAYGPGSDQ
jgi:hypothetical protein